MSFTRNIFRKSGQIFKNFNSEETWSLFFLLWGVIILAIYLLYHKFFLLFFLIFIILALLVLFPSFIYTVIRFYYENHGNKLIKNEKKNKFVKIIIRPIYAVVLLYCANIIFIFSGLVSEQNSISEITNNLLTLLFITVLVCSAFGIGKRINRFFIHRIDNNLDENILAFSMGFLVIMLVMFILGVFKFYYASIAYAIVGILFIFSLDEVYEFILSLKNIELSLKKPFFIIENFLLLSIAIIIVIYSFGIYQQFPLGWDAQQTYAVVPKIFSEQHGIVSFPYSIYAGFPNYAEMLFTLGYLLNGFTMIPGIIVVFAYLTVASLYSFGKNFFDKKSALYTVLLFITMPMVNHLGIYDNKIDLILVFYSIAALYYFFQFIEKQQKIFIFISAIFFGVTVGIKYTSVFALIIPVLILLFIVKKRITIKNKLLAFSLIIIFCFVMFSPWAIRNYINYRNIFEPLAGDIFSKNKFLEDIAHGEYAAVSDYIYKENNITFYPNQDNKDWKYFVLLPFKLTIMSRWAEVDLVSFGPLVLIFLPLIIVFVRRRDVFNDIAANLLLFFGISFVVWLLILPLVPWYLLVSMGMLILLIGHAMEHIYIYNKKVIILIILMLYILPFITKMSYERFYFPAMHTKNKWSQEHLLFMDFINQKTLKGVMWTTERPVAYYIDNSNNKVVNDQLGAIFGTILSNKSDKEVMEILRKMKVKYFLLGGNKDGCTSIYYERALDAEIRKYSPMSSDIWIKNYKNLYNFREKHLLFIAKNDDMCLYELNNLE